MTQPSQSSKQWATKQWALVLGASSGFGKQLTADLAGGGYNIVGVHLDRRGAMDEINAHIAQLKSMGVDVHYINANADGEDVQQEVTQKLKEQWAGAGQLKVLFHSLAFGSLKAFIHEDPSLQITPRELQMTMGVMASSLLFWTQACMNHKLFCENASIFSMTSSGSERMWPNYGGVAAAKSALECISRQLAVELAPYKVAVNAIRAGVTDTPALRKIPTSNQMIERVLNYSPHKRLTTTQDVSQFVMSFLSNPNGYFVTGNIFNVDGGEMLS